jgi:hypothetical protein
VCVFVICFCFAGNIHPGIHIGNIDGKTDEEGVFWTVESCRIRGIVSLIIIILKNKPVS